MIALNPGSPRPSIADPRAGLIIDTERDAAGDDGEDVTRQVTGELAAPAPVSAVYSRKSETMCV